MTVWTDFLAARGAEFDRQSVNSFGDPAGELAAARDDVVVCDLAPLGALRVAGPDAAGFLQGQLTNDVLSLAPGSSQLAAWCSPKGRILANFLVRRIDAGSFELMLPAELLQAIHKRLAMFVLRSKVAIDDAGDMAVRLGIGGPGAMAAVRGAAGDAPALHRSVTTSDGAFLALPGARYVALGEPQRATPLWDRLVGDARAAGFPAWRWLTIRAGIPIITPPTSDQFVPQMLNLDALDGVNFQKGCYTGQEVVARTQYLGRLKERLVLAHCDGSAPAAGDRLYSAAFGEQACGTIVNAATAPGGGSDLLAVLQLAARDNGDVRVGEPRGRSLALLPLPYPLPDAAPRRGSVA